MRRGRPEPRASIRVVVEEHFELVFAATDDHGCAEFAVPLGMHRVFAASPRPDQAKARVPLGDLVVTAGEGPQIAILHLPEGFGR
jgi:hypothetical protein